MGPARKKATPIPAWREALRVAQRRWEIEHHDVTLSEIGVRMAEFLDRPKPYTRQEVSNFFMPKSQPTFTVGCALCYAVGADPMALARAYLAGRRAAAASSPPAPGQHPQTGTKLAPRPTGEQGKKRRRGA